MLPELRRGREKFNIGPGVGSVCWVEGGFGTACKGAARWQHPRNNSMDAIVRQRISARNRCSQHPDRLFVERQALSQQVCGDQIVAVIGKLGDLADSP